MLRKNPNKLKLRRLEQTLGFGAGELITQAHLHRTPRAAGSASATFVLLLAVGIAVTVFRGAYEQMGNTVALWADSGIDIVFSLSRLPFASGIPRPPTSGSA